MLAMLGIMGCLIYIGVASLVISAGFAGYGVYQARENGEKQEAAAKKAREQQSQFQIRQLRTQKADKARQKLLTQANLKKARAAVATSIGLNNLMAERATRESNNLRIENARSGAGVNGAVSAKPYSYGNPH